MAAAANKKTRNPMKYNNDKSKNEAAISETKQKQAAFGKPWATLSPPSVVCITRNLQLLESSVTNGMNK